MRQTDCRVDGRTGSAARDLEVLNVLRVCALAGLVLIPDTCRATANCMRDSTEPSRPVFSRDSPQVGEDPGKKKKKTAGES